MFYNTAHPESALPALTVQYAGRDFAKGIAASDWEATRKELEDQGYLVWIDRCTLVRVLQTDRLVTTNSIMYEVRILEGPLQGKKFWTFREFLCTPYESLVALPDPAARYRALTEPPPKLTYTKTRATLTNPKAANRNARDLAFFKEFAHAIGALQDSPNFESGAALAVKRLKAKYSLPSYAVLRSLVLDGLTEKWPVESSQDLPAVRSSLPWLVQFVAKNDPRQ
jgi:hypothetical protein